MQDIRAHQEPVWAVKFSPCGLYLATAGKDGALKIWMVYTHKFNMYEAAKSKIDIADQEVISKSSNT